MQQPIGFRTVMTRRLRRLGLRGRSLRVSLAATGFALAGEESGGVELPFERMERLRAGFEEGRTRVYLLKIWMKDDPKFIEFAGNDRLAYAAFVRAAIALLLRERPGVAVERGSGLFAPLFLIGAFSLLSLAMAGFALFLAIEGEDWTVALGGLAVALVFLVTLGPWMLSRYRPRPLRSLEDLEPMLPPG